MALCTQCGARPERAKGFCINCSRKRARAIALGLNPALSVNQHKRRAEVLRTWASPTDQEGRNALRALLKLRGWTMEEFVTRLTLDPEDRCDEGEEVPDAETSEQVA